MAESALRETQQLPHYDDISDVSDMLARAWLAGLDGLEGAGGPGAGAGRPADHADTPERIVLTDLASRLISILSAALFEPEEFEPQEAEAVGRALVVADFTGDGMLGRSLWVLMLRLPAAVRALPGGPGAPCDMERRLAEVVGALANGYVSELQARTLAEQESIRRVELDAERLLRQRLLHQATHDSLTGLPNRAATFARLSAALAADPGTRVGLCYVDLDGFKAVNDRHGHGAGDELLAVIAERIGRVARDHGAFAARIGGDEFVVLAEAGLAEAGPAKAGPGETPPGEMREAPLGRRGMIALAADVLAEARRPVPLTPEPVTVSACAGVVERAAAGTTAEGILAAADTALYRAKSRGPDTVATDMDVPFIRP
jgi:GGDEF domain-containing protein